MNKKKLGQFYTTNYNYILQNMNIPENVSIIEPFTGTGELIKFINEKGYKGSIEKYDIEPKDEGTVKRDTFLNPPCYKNKFVITNPPFLAKNKNKDKKVYDLYKTDDLYKCLVIELTKQKCIGGILILPLNFFCSNTLRNVKLRKDFFSVYSIKVLNIFEERVFNDTSYTICSFQFETGKTKNIQTYFYPLRKNIILSLEKGIINEKIYTLPKSKVYKIERAVKNTPENDVSNILLKCIDDNKDNLLKLSFVPDDKKYIDITPKLSARSYASLVIKPFLEKEKQLLLIENFNSFINKERVKYNSLFLTNYREDNRKRISFELAFRICSFLLRDLKDLKDISETRNDL